MLSVVSLKPYVYYIFTTKQVYLLPITVNKNAAKRLCSLVVLVKLEVAIRRLCVYQKAKICHDNGWSV